jgi:phospholipid/cholesterol/gamma-HCH transport system permease protein
MSAPLAMLPDQPDDPDVSYTLDPDAAARDAGLEGHSSALVKLTGNWTADRAPRVERLMNDVKQRLGSSTDARIDLTDIGRMDTMGAYVIERLRHEAAADGALVQIVAGKPEHGILLRAIATRRDDKVTPPPRSGMVTFLADVGQVIVGAGRDLLQGISFLGEVATSFGRQAFNPSRFRGIAVVNQLEQIAFRGAPIIVLISFLVGCIVAQQGIFQLQRFGASVFIVDLTGILILRELSVLLTAIMIAGRSGSAFTAEIGSMKMREEIDALRVMGLDPIETLVAPRLLALMIGLPILTFLSAMAGLLGAGLVAWLYGGIGLDSFIARLQTVITWKHFTVGLIKAPFMAVVIGVIACIEGLAVKGSAESLGRQVTSSVVKAIFMVIVVDGLFAMFFAAIRY